MLPNMARYARDTDARTLPDVLAGADVFLGLSAPARAEAGMAAADGRQAADPGAGQSGPGDHCPTWSRAARPDAIIATGRSDYPNQVNNVLCFPFIFRGALDVGATTINEAMKIAAVEAIAELARVEASEVVAAAYGGAAPVFGPDYIIPEAVRSAADPAYRPGGGARGDGERRGAPADRRFRRLSARRWNGSCSAPAS